jgi:ketosteroid isomerase-like protein
MKMILAALLLAWAAPHAARGQAQGAREAAVREVLKAEREQRDAYLRRDLAATERLVADEYVLTIQGGEVGGKAALMAFLKEEPADPTLTLDAEETQVRVDGDTAVVVGRRVERRKSPDNGREGVAYARYTRTYVRRQGRWRLLAEHLQAVPGERVAAKVDTSVYGDYVGRYASEVFTFAVVREGDRLIVVPDDRRRPKAEVLPETESEFFVTGRNFRIAFMRGRKGQVAYALLQINGVDMRARRTGE